MTNYRDATPEEVGRFYGPDYDGVIPDLRLVVPVEPDYEAMVEAGRKANIDLVPEECEMLFRAGIGDNG